MDLFVTIFDKVYKEAEKIYEDALEVYSKKMEEREKAESIAKL